MKKGQQPKTETPRSAGIKHKMTKKDIHEYDSIIGLPHPTSSKHPRMPLQDRAAQFSPFAALTGHHAAIRETERLTHERTELSEDEKAELNERLLTLSRNLDKEQKVEITYFVPDEKKSGGTYITLSGIVKKIDKYRRTIVMADGTVIPIEEIREI